MRSRFPCLVIVPVYQLTPEKSRFLFEVSKILCPEISVFHFDGPTGAEDAKMLSIIFSEISDGSQHFIHSKNQQLGEDLSRYQASNYLLHLPEFETFRGLPCLTFDDDGENSIADITQLYEHFTCSTAQLCFGSYTQTWSWTNFRNLASLMYHRQFQPFGVSSAPTFCCFDSTLLDVLFEKPTKRWQCRLLESSSEVNEYFCAARDYADSTYTLFELIRIFFEDPFAPLTVNFTEVVSPIRIQ